MSENPYEPPRVLVRNQEFSATRMEIFLHILGATVLVSHWAVAALHDWDVGLKPALHPSVFLFTYPIGVVLLLVGASHRTKRLTAKNVAERDQATQ